MNFRNRSIECERNLLEALKQMDALDKKLLIVVDKNQYKGLLSAGDIQRAIIKNMPLETPVKNVLRKRIRIAKPKDSFEDIQSMMIGFRMELCPVVNENNEIIDIYFWEDIFLDKKPKPKKQFNLPVVFMAGGLGSRLKPLTNVLPKPLVPIGEKTVIEEIFDHFGQSGCNQFFISVNYKADLIEFYLRSQNLPYDLFFFKEEKPLGTAGSLSLLKNKINTTFFVSNCDVLVEQDYSEILDFHQINKNEITIVAAMKHFTISYGTIETGNKGKLLKLREKPEITYKINSGMYILEPHLMAEIPENTFFHITDMVDNIMKRKGRIGVFPISERSWKDMGETQLLKQFFNER